MSKKSTQNSSKTLFQSLLEQSPAILTSLQNGGKFNFNNLLISLTRNCNIKCAHCLRGESDTQSITPEIIDKMLDMVNSIEQLTLSGGEPFMNPDTIDYIVDGIIKRNITLSTFLIITNGMIKNQKIAEAFSKLSAYQCKRYKEIQTNNPEWWNEHIKFSPEKLAREDTALLITEDRYHTEAGVSREQRKETIKWYIQNTTNVRCKIRDDEKYKKSRILRKIGREANLNDTSLRILEERPYRITFDKEKLKFMDDVHLDVNGDLYITCIPSMDVAYRKNHPPLLNIMTDELTMEIINGWNYRYPWDYHTVSTYAIEATAHRELTKAFKGNAKVREVARILRENGEIMLDMFESAMQQTKKQLEWAMRDWPYFLHDDYMAYVDEISPIMLAHLNMKGTEEEKKLEPRFDASAQHAEFETAHKKWEEKHNLHRMIFLSIDSVLDEKLSKTADPIEREAILAEYGVMIADMTPEELMERVKTGMEYAKQKVQQPKPTRFNRREGTLLSEYKNHFLL